MPMKKMVRNKMVKVLPVVGALADSVIIDGC
jgi:hypothetical protein